MAGKQQLKNQQMSSMGMKRKDNGEIEHNSEKTARSRKNDNVKPRS